VPVFAPALGQAILIFSGWRSIFGAFVVLALVNMLWLWLRQPETLALADRKPFTLQTVAAAFVVVVRCRPTVAYTMVSGCVSGAFLSYLNTSQQIFQVQYGLGRLFPVYFAVLAASVGSASLLNGRMVMKLGMHALANRALGLMMALSWLFLVIAWLYGGHPPLWLFMLICCALFFCIGILFGNLNAIAMEPLGHVAGTAASVIGSATTLLAAVLGFLIGRAYDGSLLPIAFGFASLTVVSVLIIARLKE